MKVNFQSVQEDLIVNIGGTVPGAKGKLGQSKTRTRRGINQPIDPGAFRAVSEFPLKATDPCFCRQSDKGYELVDSGSQWREVQRRQAGEVNSTNSIQQANVVSSKRSGYVNGVLETGSEVSYSNRHRKHRRHRSRSCSPSENKNWLSEEIKKHLEFDLIDTVGMSEAQLREIPYTVVQTNHAKQLKIKHWGKKYGLILLISTFVILLMFFSDSISDDKVSHSPPPPYSPYITEASKLQGSRPKNDQQAIELLTKAGCSSSTNAISR